MVVHFRASLVAGLVYLVTSIFTAAAAQDDTRTPGRWVHVEQTNPFDNAQRSLYAAIYPDSVTGVAHLQEPVPLRVACEEGKRIRINVFGPTPRVTNPGNAFRTDYTVWHVRFENGKIWKQEGASVYASTTPGYGFVQAAAVEKEMVQHLVASRWVWIAYPTSLGEDLIAWYTLPGDTEASLARVYEFCKKTMPGHRAPAGAAADATGPTPTSGLLGRP